MRKLLPLALMTGTLAIAGCGGGGGGGNGDSPLDNALRYLPADAPFAVAIDTDTDGEQFENAGDLSDRFPFGDEVQEQLEELVQERGAEVEDVQEALGNPFVVGSTDAGSFVDSPSGEDTAFVGAIQAADEDALDALIEGDGAEEDGEVDGAQLYRDDSGDSFAIDGDVLVVAGSKRELEAALATRDGDDGMTEEDFDAGTEGVADDALVRVYLDVGGLLRAGGDAEQALRSKWVGALRTAGIALTFEADRVAIDLQLNTDSDGLTDADLPMAAGADAPQVLDRDGQINLALRDPAQVIAFAQATAESVDGSGFESFEEGKAELERELDIDLDDDLLAQLDGDLQVSIDPDGGSFAARAELADAAAFERTLTRIEDVLPSIAEGAAGEGVDLVAPSPGEDLYALETSGGERISFGVVDGAFVIANDADVAASLADADTAAVAGASGALVLNANAERLARTALQQAEGQGFDLGDRLDGAIDTGPLDELIGSFEVTTDGLSGNFTLTTDD